MNKETPPLTLVKTWLSLATTNHPLDVQSQAYNNLKTVFGGINRAECYVQRYEENQLPVELVEFDPAI